MGILPVGRGLTVSQATETNIVNYSPAEPRVKVGRILVVGQFEELQGFRPGQPSAAIWKRVN